jgi:hypothetical protein
MPDDTQILAEIRDLLKQQNRLMQDIKSQNKEMAARNAASSRCPSCSRSRRARDAGALQSTRMPAFLMMAPHLSISAFRWACTAAGVACSLEAG